MNIIISNTVNRPIYEQIYEQIRQSIISDKIHEGEILPSIRNLARDLRISVITTKRAYDELEKDGYIITVASKGCFVAPKNTQLVRETALREIEGHLEKIIELSALCSINDDDIIKMFNELKKEIKR